MGRTPTPPKGQNIESMVVPSQKGAPYKGGSRASYAPSASINEHSYGRDGGKPAVLGGVPEVVVGGASEVGQVPAMPGTLRIGDDKNVSTPVSG